ncbi:MAG: DUF3127 domain-containing protein [Bacteroidales bacterium]
MELRGRIFAILPMQTGQGRNGEWKKQDYVLETLDQYPKKVCFNMWGDKIDQYPVNVGEEVVVSFDVESREYNGRWYTDVRAWKIDKASQQEPVQYYAPEQVPAAAPSGSSTPFPSTSDMPADDLPF